MSRCGGNCGKPPLPEVNAAFVVLEPCARMGPAPGPLGIASVDPRLPTELSTTGALSNDKSAHSHPQRFSLNRGAPTLATHAWRACCLIRLVSSVTWL